MTIILLNEPIQEIRLSLCNFSESIALGLLSSDNASEIFIVSFAIKRIIEF